MEILTSVKDVGARHLNIHLVWFGWFKLRFSQTNVKRAWVFLVTSAVKWEKIVRSWSSCATGKIDTYEKLDNFKHEAERIHEFVFQGLVYLENINQNVSSIRANDFSLVYIRFQPLLMLILQVQSIVPSLYCNYVFWKINILPSPSCWLPS